MKILVTGGAGFIGSLLTPALLDTGHKVRVLDNLMYGGQSLLPNFFNKKFEFLKGDIRNASDVKAAVKGVDAIINLAAIVGYPACKKDPRLAEGVNYGGTVLLDQSRSREQLILFASTGSNYGTVVDEVCTEETPLNPLSVYGDTKVRAEQYLLDVGGAICFRFATAFGLSPRLRLDLLINDFTYQAVKNKQVIVYERNFKRTFIHVRDIVRSFLFAIDGAHRMKDNVYNVGSDSMNCSKEDVVIKIADRVDFSYHFADVGHDADQRNYEVSYEKIQKLGFDTTVTIEEGIDELVSGYEVIERADGFSNV